MNKISIDYLNTYKDNAFLDLVSGEIIPEGWPNEFSFWHSFSGAKSIENVLVDGDGSIVADYPAVVRARKPTVFRVFQDQRKKHAGLAVSLVGGGAASASAGVSVVPVLNDRIDWTQRPQLLSQYMTEVIETFGGAEQRVALRDEPRLSATTQFSLCETDRHLFEEKYLSVDGMVMLPLWVFQSACVLDKSIATLATSNRFLESADYWLITGGSDNAVVKVNPNPDGTFDCFFLVEKTLKKDTLAVPLFPAILSQESNSRVLSNFFESHNITFDIDQSHNNIKHEEVEDFDFIYDEIEYAEENDQLYEENVKYILPFSPDRSVDISVKYDRLRDVFDPGLGIKSIKLRSNGSIRTFNYTFKFFNENDRQRFDDFVHMMRGAQREFYCESPTHGYQITADIQDQSKTITVKGKLINNERNTSAPALAITLYNNKKLYRKIESVVGNGDGTQTITVTQELPEIKLGDIVCVNPLYLTRFEADDFLYTFDTNEVSTITKTIKQIIYAEHVRY